MACDEAAREPCQNGQANQGNTNAKDQNSHRPNLPTPLDQLDEVDHINGHEERDDGMILLRVLWAGYPPSAATWEDENNLCNGALNAVLDYWAQFPGGRDEALGRDPANPETT
ncbi:hypothetical protein LX36DRAFT_670179 [Colletotrichum falcatum]|nr:hypothetical protein LX36DRAFT_670179 [Colletotrichum falcatum]